MLSEQSNSWLITGIWGLTSLTLGLIIFLVKNKNIEKYFYDLLFLMFWTIYEVITNLFKSIEKMDISERAKNTLISIHKEFDYFRVLIISIAFVFYRIGTIYETTKSETSISQEDKNRTQLHSLWLSYSSIALIFIVNLYIYFPQFKYQIFYLLCLFFSLLGVGLAFYTYSYTTLCDKKTIIENITINTYDIFWWIVQIFILPISLYLIGTFIKFPNTTILQSNSYLPNKYGWLILLTIFANLTWLISDIINEKLLSSLWTGLNSFFYTFLGIYGYLNTFSPTTTPIPTPVSTSIPTPIPAITSIPNLSIPST